MKWNDIEGCEYPICDADESVPVWIVSGDEVIQAWYRNPKMNDCWFEDDNEVVIKANLWIETLSVTGAPEHPNLNT